LLDEDLGADWSSAVAARPDFLFIAMGGSLSEAVNPPSDLFSAAAILSPAYRAPDEFDLLRALRTAESREEQPGDPDNACFVERRAEAVSRIVQAAGRVQRSPESPRPVFLLNRDFADHDFLAAWPLGWYRESAQELVFPSLETALQNWRSALHAS
jgi:Rad3-related DNA helicase